MIASNGIATKTTSLAPRDYAFDVGTAPEYFYRLQGLDPESGGSTHAKAVSAHHDIL